MSLQPEATPSKKRKHGESSGAHNVTSSPSHSHKKAKKKEHNEKGNEKHKKSKSKKSRTDSQFKVVNASILVSIPPKFFSDPLGGVKEMLDSLVMKYVPALSGVVIAHTNAKFASRTAVIKNECPFSICTVNFDATVWSPQIGMKLTGRINLCSPDHISILVNRTFNVSIPRHHIPTENWEFEYGPAENDRSLPEKDTEEVTQAQAQEGEKAETGATKWVHFDGARPSPVGEEMGGDEMSEASLGFWQHKVTGEKLGDKNGNLEFTVVGLTIANQMLSLVGSIQPDPFSPEHKPKPVIKPPSNSERDAQSVENDLPIASPSDLEDDNEEMVRGDGDGDDEIEDWDDFDKRNDAMTVDNEEQQERSDSKKKTKKSKP